MNAFKMTNNLKIALWLSLTISILVHFIPAVNQIVSIDSASASSGAVLLNILFEYLITFIISFTLFVINFQFLKPFDRERFNKAISVSIALVVSFMFVALLNDFLFSIKGLFDTYDDEAQGPHVYLLIDIFLSTVVLVCIYGIRIIEQNQKNQREFDLAREIQINLLPETSYNNRNLEIYFFSNAAQEVGGDYVDVIEAQNGTYVIIADVSGKGLSAALYMVRMQALVHFIIEKSQPTPKELFLELNNYIKSDKKDKTFITGAAAFFPKDDQSFLFARAGHTTPFFFYSLKDSLLELRTDGFALGMTSNQNMKNQLEERKLQFKPGDSLLFYTDGLTESRNEKGEEYGKERLIAIMEENGSLNAQSLLRKIQDSLEEFVGNEKPLDDITFSCIHRPHQMQKVQNE